MHFSWERSFAEDLFLVLLPPELRAPIRDRWVRGPEMEFDRRFPYLAETIPSLIAIDGEDPIRDFGEQVWRH
jgi:hypothetical protein